MIAMVARSQPSKLLPWSRFSVVNPQEERLPSVKPERWIWNDVLQSITSKCPPRRRIGQLLAAIREIDPDALYTTSDIRSVHEGGRGQREKMVRAGWPRRGMRK